MTPAISVVIPTCGRPAMLERCIDALARQTLPFDQFEVIVVDDSSLCEGPEAARERGWLRARAPVVAFTDDDTEPAPDWLENGLRCVEARAEVVASNCFVRKATLERLHWARIRPGTRWDYYLMLALLVLALAGSLPAFLGWLFLTLRFFAHRLRNDAWRVMQLPGMAWSSMVTPPAAIFWKVVGTLRFRTALS